MPNEKKIDEEHGVRLSYKFRIYPTPSQCEAIKANIDASRFVYNHYLRVRMDAYERTKQELPAYPAATGEVGITFGASHWAVTSDGQVMDLPERIKRLQRRLAIAQRDLARKELGSQNYLKQKRKVARVNERIADVRKAATHNATRELVNGYGTIAARQMNSKDMQQHGSAATKDLPRKVKKMLNRKMIDGNFAEFNRQLAYKSAWANRSFVEVPGDTPTAQVCSRCGHEELVLARDLRPAWTCPECGAGGPEPVEGQ